MSLILGIESSCDETAVAIIKDGKKVLSNIVATQIDTHKKFGGVIPEIASRIHVENITYVINEALEKANISVEEIDGIAITQGPGLIGSLHVGVIAAKTLAWMYNKPLIPVHHIAGHIYANELITDLKFPLLSLVVSGGHTELIYMKHHYHFEVLSTTQDDAIGEAYDKVAKVMGLPYPGGPQIDHLAKKGKKSYELPKVKIDNPFDFSFSGIKSGVLQLISRLQRNNEEIVKEDLACSFQETVLDELIKRVDLALQTYDIRHIVLAGGVAANSRLREKMEQFMKDKKQELTIPPLYCCTDNAAMIAIAGEFAYHLGIRAGYDLKANPSLDITIYNGEDN